ncbi:MAG: hypothetical protein AB8G99_13190 [Planctomycetaceae bacterium]
MNPLDELNRLTSMFPDAEPLLARVEHTPVTATPEPYREMLAHHHHMTIEMESYHKTPVDVVVLDQKDDEALYCRKILLVKEGTDFPVQFGLVRFDFQYVTDAVREEILAGEIPLGRVLINHNVLRDIDLGAILRIESGPALANFLKMEEGQTTYGRLATIFCNNQPAVDLLEISRPLT